MAASSHRLIVRGTYLGQRSSCIRASDGVSAVTAASQPSSSMVMRSSGDVTTFGDDVMAMAVAAAAGAVGAMGAETSVITTSSADSKGSGIVAAAWIDWKGAQAAAAGGPTMESSVNACATLS